MRRIAITLGLLLCAGCTDFYLDQEERLAFRAGSPGLQPTTGKTDGVTGRGSTLMDAAALSTRLAEAYFQTARRSSRSQDVASGVVILSAAAVVAGGVTSASDTALANRALVGVGAETVARRGVPKTSILSVLNGATAMNCVATVATLYSAQDSPVRNSPLAKEVTFGIIREIRIAVRNDLARDVAQFSAIVTAFEGALPSAPGAAPNGRGFSRFDLGRASQADLEAYMKRLTGCLKAPSLSDNTKK